jgi:hypothetical protein
VTGAALALSGHVHGCRFSSLQAWTASQSSTHAQRGRASGPFFAHNETNIPCA